MQGDVMESIARTWGKKGVLGFFSGNSAGTTHLASAHCTALLHRLLHEVSCTIAESYHSVSD